MVVTKFVDFSLPNLYDRNKSVEGRTVGTTAMKEKHSMFIS